MIWMGRGLRLFFGLMVYAILYFSFKDLRLLDCGSLQAWMGQWGGFAPLIFLLVYCMATLGFFPGVLLTLTAGMIFGSLVGTFLVVLSSTLSATLMFWLSRTIFHEHIAKRLEARRWFARFRSELEANTIRYLIFVRLIPLFPYSAINLASGLTGIRLRDYVIGSFLGMIPGTLAFVYLGEAGCALADPLARGELSWRELPLDALGSMALVILLLAALAVTPLFLKRKRQKKNENQMP